MDFQILNDIKGLGLKDVFDTYAFINQQKINQGVARSNSLIAEVNAQADLWRARAAATTQSVVGTVGSNKLLMVGVVLSLGFLAYKLIK